MNDFEDDPGGARMEVRLDRHSIPPLHHWRHCHHQYRAGTRKDHQEGTHRHHRLG